MNLYRLIKPLLFKMDAERAHHLGLSAGKFGAKTVRPVLHSIYAYEHPALVQDLLGLRFDTPVGIAAGFDKNAEMIQFWDALGVGLLDIGSVTAKAAGGNPKPRAFRLPQDEALVNRMGLNNIGADAVAGILKDLTRPNLKVGVNITKTHDPNILGDAGLDDFCYSYKTLAHLGDFVTLNVSCPNTAEGKTFEDPQALNSLLERIFRIKEKHSIEQALLVKLSPVDVEDDTARSSLDELLGVLGRFPIDALVMTNTSNSRSGLKSGQDQLETIGKGGLSGKPLNETALKMTRYVYRATEGKQILVGVGGIHDGASAWERICAGASLLQLYTALVYQGPGLLKKINRYLVEQLEKASYSSIQEAVGSKA